MSDIANHTELRSSRKIWLTWMYRLILVIILGCGAYLRLVGIDWDEEQHLHPDERFLTMVESAIQPPGVDHITLGPPPSTQTQEWRNNYIGVIPDCQEWGGYFDTACSPLNPNNRGYDYYVYGTLPIFIVRYAAELQGFTGYGEIYLVGRMLSALSDLLVIVLVYAVAAKVYDQRVAVIASAFAAFSVLLIQQSHFFTVDTFTNFFIMLALYFAVVFAKSRQASREGAALPRDQLEQLDGKKVYQRWVREFLGHPLFWPSVFFGVVLGMAVASKINAAPLALTLPLAALIYYLRLTPKAREQQVWKVFAFLIVAAFTSLVVFRIFQPYAFSGPGFFGIKPNKAWIDDLSALKAQTGGDVDFPPALQWARRPIWFSFQNLVLFGLGLPLGVLAWIGFALMGWRLLKGEIAKHGVLWGWVGFYFVWQSIQWNSTMRYQLPIYPLLAIFAAWFIIHLWDKAGSQKTSTRFLKRSMVFILGIGVVGSSLAWSYAFSRIYTRPHTRVEASRWLFQNMPGPVNLSVLGGNGIYNQPLPYPEEILIQAETPYQMRFTALADGDLAEVHFPHMVDERLTAEGSLELRLTSLLTNELSSLETIPIKDILSTGESSLRYFMATPIPLHQEESYQLSLNKVDGYGNFALCRSIVLEIQTIDGPAQRELAIESGCALNGDLPLVIEFTPGVEGILQTVSLEVEVVESSNDPLPKTFAVELVDTQGKVMGIFELTDDFSASSDPRGEAYRIPVPSGVELVQGETYTLNFSLTAGTGAIALSGATAANESSWDDGLPLRMDGYDPYGGIYRGGLNFEMYWDDNQEKYDRFVSTLDQVDYILISSSRQWGTTTRVPERYPLTSEYYRQLIGCPIEQSIEWCYNVAQPGDFQGNLGFELIKTFQSNPSIGDFEINDQFAEEAFTVYDHPKVFVFEKSENYDPAVVREILGRVDLTKVIRITPKQADSNPGNLQLPPDRLQEQRQGGTWSQLFNPEALHNRVQIIAVLVWYASMGLLGLLVYPLVRLAMPGLSDRGYSFARISGLLFLSGVVWLASSARIPFDRFTISLALIGLFVINGFLAYFQKDALLREVKENWKYYLWVEGLFLAIFIVGLLIRFGNPDLWHPWKGGEKPMDFSYFNAVLKSTSFPPYDPWFAGGYINYYYYGFMVVGVLVKFLGIVPSIAYNLILPTLLSMIAIGAFSVVWNLAGNQQTKNRKGDLKDNGKVRILGMRMTFPFGNPVQFLASLFGALCMAFLGNLGVLQMFAQAFQKNAAPGGDITGAGIITKLAWTVSGFVKTVTGIPIPLRIDEWYWNPSRVISYEHGNPITEFPYFTFIYGDLHAHLIALPVALLAIAWAVSVVRSRAWKGESGLRFLSLGAGLVLGGLAIGALYPMNLSDIYTYLPLAAVGLIYAIWRYENTEALPGLFRGLPKNSGKLVLAGLTVLALYGLSQLFYLPYSHWYGQGYSDVRIWDGTHTPISQYLTHWGFFLFILVSWMAYESIDWMATTPASALRKLEPYRSTILGGVVTLCIVIFVLGFNLYPEGLPPDTFPIGLGVHIVWLILPITVWSGVLLLRPGMPDSKRMVLFFVGTGLVLTLMVEIIVVSGDIGRMNTVFKFYLHAWTLFAVSCGAVISWLWKSLRKWPWRFRMAWQFMLVMLFFSTALFPLLGSIAKIGDRMEASAPLTLDGMKYMQFSTYHDEGAAMDLSQDYNAIRWMQDNIAGSPVIVEANSVEYHWGTRYTVYTGLPGVVGWNWHERQQRTTPHDWVFERVDAVHEFYQTEDLAWTQDFLRKYDVSYIIFGQLERAKYASPGLEKFPAQEGRLWKEVFRDRDTVIYEVIWE